LPPPPDNTEINQWRTYEAQESEGFEMRIGDRVGAIAERFKREIQELTGKMVFVA